MFSNATRAAAAPKAPPNESGSSRFDVTGQLLENIAARDIHAITALINAGVRLNPKSEAVCRAVCSAAFDGDVDMLKVLVSSNAAVDIVDAGGNSPLQLAMMRDRGPMITYLKKLLSTNAILAKAAIGPSTKSSSTKGHSALLDAIEANDASLTRKLIAEKASINKSDGKGPLPLRIAAERGFTDVMEVLISSGKCNVSKSWTVGAMLRAVSSGNTEVLRLLVAAKAAVNAQVEQSENLLMFALSKGDTNAADILLGAGARVNGVAPDVRQAVCRAATEGDLDMLHRLVSAKASVDVSKRGGDPLLLAEDNNHTAVVDYIRHIRSQPVSASDRVSEDSSELRASVDKKSQRQSSKVSIAITKSDFDLSSVRGSNGSEGDEESKQRSKKSNVDVAPPVGSHQTKKSLATPQPLPKPAGPQLSAPSQAVIADSARYDDALFEAVAINDTVTILSLLSQRASVNAMNQEGETVLQFALTKNSSNSAQVLIKSRAQVTVADFWAQTMLFDAASQGSAHVMHLLIDAKVDINPHKQNLLISALIGSHASCIEFLIEAGAALDPQADFVTDAIHRAAKKGNVAVLRALVSAKADAGVCDKQGRKPLWRASTHSASKL